MSVSLFIPCYVDQFWPSAGVAMARVLRRVEVDIEYRSGQTCCGQPAYNAGYVDEARDIAERLVRLFAGAETIVCPSGSCVAMVKHRYPELFEGHALADDVVAIGERTYEFSQYLVDVLGIEKLGAELHGRAVFHDGCHALRDLGISEQPRLLLRSVRGLTLVETASPEACCGFGGLFAVKQSALSIAMADEKIQEALAVHAQCIISTEASCILHIRGRVQRRGLDLETMHLAEVLAAREPAR